MVVYLVTTLLQIWNFSQNVPAKILKIGQYLAKIWRKVCSLLFGATQYLSDNVCMCIIIWTSVTMCRTCQYLVADWSIICCWVTQTGLHVVVTKQWRKWSTWCVHRTLLLTLSSGVSSSSTYTSHMRSSSSSNISITDDYNQNTHLFHICSTDILNHWCCQSVSVIKHNQFVSSVHVQCRNDERFQSNHNVLLHLAILHKCMTMPAQYHQDF